jgi:hypothetical protein
MNAKSPANDSSPASSSSSSSDDWSTQKRAPQEISGDPPSSPAARVTGGEILGHELPYAWKKKLCFDHVGCSYQPEFNMCNFTYQTYLC